VLIKEELSELL